ncbi:MAG: SDR family NAD(P)-dependent oxidoreductase [Solirubrobacterales bacterium]
MRIEPGMRAFITGASRGIGAALARALADRGLTVGLAARTTAELEQLAATLPGEHVVIACDVTSSESVRDGLAQFVELAGGLELLVANAGITHYGPFREQPLEEMLQMSEVNWEGTLRTVHYGLPYMLDRARGQVVIISSGAALRSFPWAAVYGGTKAAQRMFAEALRHELSGTGVSLTTVYPGEISTSLHDHEQHRMPDWYRPGQAKDPAVLAQKIIEAVEEDRRSLWYPPIVRLLQHLHNLDPRISDAILRRLRGGTVAHRKD